MNTVAALLILTAVSGGNPSGHLHDSAAQPRAPALQLAQADSGAAMPGQVPGGEMRTTPDILTAPATGIESPDGPPAGSLQLSQIVRSIESQPDFAYLVNLDWKDGKYDIAYVTRQGERRDMLVDPRTGKETGRLGPGGGTVTDAPATAPRPAGPAR